MAFVWLPGEAPRVAVACDDGVVRIFTAEGLSPGLTYARSMPALGSRLLSVAWHPSGKSVLVGTAAGTLHSWHLASSRELLRINVGAHSIPVHFFLCCQCPQSCVTAERPELCYDDSEKWFIAKAAEFWSRCLTMLPCSPCLARMTAWTNSTCSSCLALLE